MALVIQDAISSNTSADISASIIFTHTVTAGVTVLYAAVMVDNATDTNPVATYDAAAMDLVGEVIGAAGSQGVAVFRKISPSAGDHTIDCSADTGAGGAIVINFAGGDTTTPDSDVQTGSGAVRALSLTCTTASGDIVLDFGCVNGYADIVANPPVVGADQTSRVNTNFQLDAGANILCSTQAGASGGAMTWSWGTDSTRRAHIAFNVKAAGGGASIGGALNVHVRKAL